VPKERVDLAEVADDRLTDHVAGNSPFPAKTLVGRTVSPARRKPLLETDARCGACEGGHLPMYGWPTATLTRSAELTSRCRLVGSPAVIHVAATRQQLQSPQTLPTRRGRDGVRSSTGYAPSRSLEPSLVRPSGRDDQR
jgi:hypothetical protein